MHERNNHALNEETAAASTLAPDTGRPLTTQEKWRFGIGFALFSLIWMTAGTSGSQVLLPQRFTELGIGVPEVILGTMNFGWLCIRAHRQTLCLVR